MSKPPIITSYMHEIPEDLQQVLDSSLELKIAWDKLTQLGRNEWICWMTFVKQEKTRLKHLERLQSDLLEGEKRPCCWPGCPHRRPNAKKWFTKK
jgi:uncharacterized protein YdeI (YjbR/CyaY-like superfamily)